MVIWKWIVWNWWNAVFCVLATTQLKIIFIRIYVLFWQRLILAYLSHVQPGWARVSLWLGCFYYFGQDAPRMAVLSLKTLKFWNFVSKRKQVLEMRRISKWIISTFSIHFTTVPIKISFKIFGFRVGLLRLKFEYDSKLAIITAPYWGVQKFYLEFLSWVFKTLLQ